jgi:DNA polymerase elongation subunit (family B)
LKIVISMDKKIPSSQNNGKEIGGIYGMIEVARVSRVPLQRLTRTTIGGALQSIQFDVANKKGYLVPPEKKNSEDFQTTMTLIQADRGGHIFEPKIGVFERVCEFDFTSMYPMIMINYNISPDTLNCDCCKEDGHKVPGLPFHTCKKKVGIIPEALILPLKKRVAYKRLSKKLPKDQAIIFKRMNDALKWILVVSFGYLGFRNSRFGRVEGHQSVCAYARELILQTQEIAERNNFRIIHGIVDSIWIQHNDFQVGIIPNKDDGGKPKLVGVSHFTKTGPRPEILKKELDELTEKANKVAREVKSKVNIPIGLDAIYKFIVFLPSRSHPEIPVLNHYWGVTYDGEIKVRGVELRRRDAPKIVKNAQQDMIDILSQASSICDFMDKLVLAKRKMEEYFARLDSGNVTPQELVIINHVSRKSSEYKVKSYQAVASERMLTKGVEIEAGQKVEYIIKNASSNNPNKRVILESEFEQYNHTYDKEKYKELLRRAFQNIIPFDYDAILDEEKDWKIKDSMIGIDASQLGAIQDIKNPKIAKCGLDRFFI